jgi:hypothetical protein
MLVSTDLGLAWQAECNSDGKFFYTVEMGLYTLYPVSSGSVIHRLLAACILEILISTWKAGEQFHHMYAHSFLKSVAGQTTKQTSFPVV